jgi:phosphoglycolate phosphatase
MYQLFIFDFDGTLADTTECITSSFQRSIEKAGLPSVSREKIIYLMGLPLKEVYKALLGATYEDDFYESLIKCYREHYTVFMPTKTHLYEGIEDILSSLKRRKRLCTIATSKKTALVALNAKYLGIHQYFDLIVGDDAVSLKKPDPEMVLHTLEELQIPDKSKVLVIGDSIFDIEMGNAAGVDTCAVTWGAHTTAELRKSSPTYLLENTAELFSLV